MADTNTNYQTYNGNIPTGNFGYGGLVGLDNSMGLSAGNQPTFIQNGNIYAVKDSGNGQYSVQQIDTVANRQSILAQQNYQAQTGSAIAGLTAGSASLGDKYSSLLASVKGVYDPLINEQTANVGAQLAQRGIAPGAGLYDNTVGSFLQPIYGSEASNQQQITAGSISDTNTYANAIASMTAGAAGTSATLPLSYGSLALSQQLLPSQIAANFGQGNYYSNLNATDLARSLISANTPQMSSNGVVFAPSLAPSTKSGYYLPPGGIGGGKANSTFSLAKKFVSNQNNKRPSTQMISHYVQ